MFDAFFDAIARVLAFFYSLPVVGGSYGLAIMLLTAAVMMLLMPLTLKATRSTIKMQEMQPKLKELQRKHKDDKQTLNTELMALYQENGINPVGGCLPMLAQLPVFLVLFNVLRGLSRRVSESPYFAVAEQARAQAGGPSIDGSRFNPRYLATESEMYVDMSQTDEMRFGPFDLALEARDVIQSDFVAGLPYVLLILFVVGTSFYQQRQVSARRSGGVSMNPQQEMILKVLPLASGIWSFIFPTGLVLYWATSNVFRIGQQSYITRAFYSDKAASSGSGDSDSGDDDPEPDDDSDDDSGGRGGRGGGTKGKGASGRPRSGDDGSDDGGPDDRDDDDHDSGGGSTKGSKGSKGSKGARKRPARASTTTKSPKGDKSSNGADADSSANGSNGSSDPVDREAAWAKRREQRAKAKANAKESGASSSRVTPKGTKPSGSKKRKRKR